MRNAGYYAINALRLEKAYRAFGPELSPEYNPVEAGLLFACKLKTDIAFLGREALEAGEGWTARGAAWSRWSSTTRDAMMWGGELVLRDGVAVGQVTSAAWAHDDRRLRGAGLRLAAATARWSPPTTWSPGSTRSTSAASVRPATAAPASALRPGQCEDQAVMTR